MTYTLSMFNTGQVTLPKKWRSKFASKKFIAEETGDGLLIKPIITKKAILKTKENNITDIEKLGGSWSQEEYENFVINSQPFNKIDPEIWK